MPSIYARRAVVVVFQVRDSRREILWILEHRPQGWKNCTGLWLSASASFKYSKIIGELMTLGGIQGPPIQLRSVGDLISLKSGRDPPGEW